MIAKNFKYKGLDLSDVVYKERQIYLQDVNMRAGERIVETPNSNAHGARITRALKNGRLFTFDIGILEPDYYIRGNLIEYLQEIIKIESDTTANQFYDLYWETIQGDDRVAKCAVFSSPNLQSGINSPLVTGQFSLYSASPRVYNPFVKLATGKKGFLGGVPYSYALPDPRGGAGNGIEVDNCGDRPAPCKIQIKGYAKNPKIFNVTNTKYRYLIEGETENVIIDNTDDVFISTNGAKTQTVIDQGIDISSKRSSGKEILLDPGKNVIVVTVEDGDPEIIITFRDTYCPA